MKMAEKVLKKTQEKGKREYFCATCYNLRKKFVNVSGFY